jgi:hypothetical protein
MTICAFVHIDHVFDGEENGQGIIHDFLSQSL